MLNKSKHKVLLIGCGNIGAQYDIDTDDVLTHAKAYSVNPNFCLSVFDIDKNTVARVSKKYDAKILNELDVDIIKQFECVSICTPTHTHLEYLKLAIAAEIPVIICEKPVSDNINELKIIEISYKKSKSKILVNYIRRFQPAYIKLKKDFQRIIEKEKLLHISIRYQRGFLNNCSHALDLISFLIGKLLKIKNLVFNSSENDHFENDPTASLSFCWDESMVNILGLTNIEFSLFEIEFYFQNTRISIIEAGNKIVIMKAPIKRKYLLPLNNENKEVIDKCLKNYMIPVISQAYMLLLNRKLNDNFVESIILNKEIIKIIERKNGKTCY